MASLDIPVTTLVYHNSMLLLRLIEIVDSSCLDRTVVEMKFQNVRICRAYLLHVLGKDILVKFRQSQYFAASPTKPIATDVPGFARPFADFCAAIPMLLQTVVRVSSGQTLHIVCAAFAADNFCREAAGLYDAMCCRIEVVAVLNFLLYLIERLSVDDGRMVVRNVVARQLSLVLNDSVRPRVFRDVALQKDISGIDHVPQGVANERYG